MSTATRCFVGLLLLAVFGAGGFGLLRGGTYGFTIFMVFPVLLGGLNHIRALAEKEGKA